MRAEAPERYHQLPFAADWGFGAFVTTRSAGSFATAGEEPVGEVMARWSAVRLELGEAGRRFVTASQVHGALVLEYPDGWSGWLRGDEGDGHILAAPGMSAAVTLADCVPVFIAHPSGAGALLHAGWRGTAAGILPACIERMAALGLAPAELRVHLGPAICGGCYEVGADVAARLTGSSTSGPVRVDLRAVLEGQARASGVRATSVSPECTLCDNELFFSHRAGDRGRQLGVLATPG